MARERDRNEPSAPLERNARTAFEYRALPAPPPSPKREAEREKRTMFGFARAALGLPADGPERPAPGAASTPNAAPAVSVARVANVGMNPSAPPPPSAPSPSPVFGPTVPHYNVPHRPREVAPPAAPPAPPPAAPRGRELPTVSLPMAAEQFAAAPHGSYAAPSLPEPHGAFVPSSPAVPTPHAPSASYSGGAQASEPARGLSPDVAPTAFVDLRAMAPVPLPTAPRGHPSDAGDDPFAAAGAGQITQPDVSRMRDERQVTPGSARAPVRQVDSDAIDVNRVLGRGNGRKLLLGSASFLVALLTAASFFARAPTADLTASSGTANIHAGENYARVGAPGARVEREREDERSRARESERERVSEREARRVAEAPAESVEPEREVRPAARASDDPPVERRRERRARERHAERHTERHAAESARESEREREQELEPQHAHTGRPTAESGGATAERAAQLYIEGKYKQALSEYRLLAEAQPNERLYREFARILKRKIIDTCLRTQPNRREQCREL